MIRTRSAGAGVCESTPAELAARAPGTVRMNAVTVCGGCRVGFRMGASHIRRAGVTGPTWRRAHVFLAYYLPELRGSVRARRRVCPG